MRWVLTTLMVPALAFGQVASVDYREAASLSNGQKGARAEQAVSGIKNVLTFALKRRQKAQENRDIIQVNCVNDVLGDVRGQLLIANKSFKALKEALSASDQELVDHEFTKISVAEMRAGGFRADIEACVGEASSYTGQTVVDLQVDDDIRQDDAAVEQDGSPFPVLDAVRPEALTGSQ